MTLFIFSCASEKPKGKTEAEVLYKEAKSLMEDERYLLATDKLNQLRNQYPYSYYAVPSELLLADILFLQESYADATAAYIIFADLHPKHEKAPYVLYKIAESYFNQLPETFDRDLEMAHEAIKYYRDLLLKYPSSGYSKEAKEKISKCQKMIQDKEKYIADFYFKVDKLKAAKWRYLNILENFEDKKLRAHAFSRALSLSYELKEYEFCHSISSSISEYDLSKKDRKEALEIKNKCAKKLTAKGNA